jgi:transcriptional regulator with XRE-family HTH domain
MVCSTTERNLNGEEIREIFSRNLKSFRNGKNISQLTLSCKTGLTHNFISDIENRKKWVSPETMAKLARVLEVEPWRLFVINPLGSDEARQLRLYLDEMTERFTKAVYEMKSMYLREGAR